MRMLQKTDETTVLSGDHDLPPLYFDIESDASDYVESESDFSDNEDEEKAVISEAEKKDVEYLSIFQCKTDEFDEEIMNVDNVEELKKLERKMLERTDKGYYRCKILNESLYNDFKRAYVRYDEPTMLKILLHKFSTKKMNH